MSPLFQERREKGGNKKQKIGRGKNGVEDNGARAINVAVGRASIQQSDAIKFAVLNRSLVEVEKQLNEVKDRKRGLGKILFENCGKDRGVVRNKMMKYLDRKGKVSGGGNVSDDSVDSIQISDVDSQESLLEDIEDAREMVFDLKRRRKATESMLHDKCASSNTPLVTL